MKKYTNFYTKACEGGRKWLDGLNTDKMEIVVDELLKLNNIDWIVWSLSQPETYKLLINRVADVNATDRDGNTAMIWAAWKGHVETVKLLLDKGADVNAVNIAGYTALILAANYGHTETVKLLLDSGANVNIVNRIGNTALILAERNGHTETVKLLQDIINK